MSATPEPPAPTPSATTCARCGKPLSMAQVGSDKGFCLNDECSWRYIWQSGVAPVPPASAPAATAGTEATRDELSHLTDRLMNWLSLAEPESYASRAEAFEWAARAHELARQRTASSTSTEAT